MNRKNILLRYLLTVSLLFPFCAVGLGGSEAKAEIQSALSTVRYIRDSVNGSTSNAGCHWVELQAYSGGKNVALNKSVTSSAADAENLVLVTDGKWDWSWQSYYAGAGTGPTWIQVDLGQQYSLDYIRVWHYYTDKRTYHNVKTQVSADGVSWRTVFDSNTSGEYAESVAGHTIQLCNTNMAVSAIGGDVRYIRDYVNGSTANGKDTWMEIAACTSDGTDVALGRNCSGDFEPYFGTQYIPDKDFTSVTDGDYTTGYDVCSLSGLHYVQIDLGQTYDIAAIRVWHYYDDRFNDYRTFHGNKTQISVDGINWTTLYDSSISGEYAESVTGHTINLDVSVTHPTSISYQINPNNGMHFINADIPLRNNSNTPVKIFVQGIENIAGGDLALANSPPTKYTDWDRLTLSQTRSNIAFAIRVKEAKTGPETWSSISQAGTVFTANMSKTLMGTLNAKATGTLVLTGNCGLAWDKQYQVLQNLSLAFES